MSLVLLGTLVTQLMRERDAVAARREEARTKGHAEGGEDDSNGEDDENKPPPSVKVRAWLLRMGMGHL